LVKKTEETETQINGKPGEETAHELQRLAWYALWARDFPKALMVAARAHELLPNDLEIESVRAHALMIVGRDDEARTIYLAYWGKHIPERGDMLWEQSIEDDFNEFLHQGLWGSSLVRMAEELKICLMCKD
jgi:hypothetical protein